MSILDGPGPTPQAAPAQAPAQAQQPAPTSDPLNPQPSGFLNDLGVDWGSVSTDNSPSDGTHRCFVTKSEVRTKKDGSKSWVFTYRVADGEPQAGRTKDEWRPIPNVRDGKFVTDKDESNAGWLKQRLMSLGVPESRIGTVTPVDVQGAEVYVTLVTKTNNSGTFQNVTNVKLTSEVPAGALGNNQQAQQVQGLI